VLTAALLCASCRDANVMVPDPPVVRARGGLAAITLTAARRADGRDTFVFDGGEVPPTIRVRPGETLEIHYVNAFPVPSPAMAPNGQMNMSNLHFHGLSVSPRRPQDDVVDMIAMPGEALDYKLTIPRDHLPGLFWYHTHPHGESHQQVLDGMSGALIVEGVERYAPAVQSLRERVLVIRAEDIAHDSRAARKRASVEVERSACGESHDPVDRVFTVNGVLRPAIDMRIGERQFWRIVNAAPDRYLDIEVPHQRFEVVAYDGFPIASRDPVHATRDVNHVLLPPAGRVEAIVTTPSNEGRAVFRTRCVDTGPDGDPNPGMILADIVATPGVSPAPADVPRARSELPGAAAIDVEPIERRAPVFTATFTEGDHHFYMNGRLFSPDDPPMIRAKVGELQHWRIVNDTREIHPMHIHQAHFLAFMENDRPMLDPEWLDTVNVPAGGSVDVVMDFTDPEIRGMSVFHCHLLNHEDKGMMAKILFE
jgi:FtsP/CotA-like multicopper oxidase with cupredoxin domain